MQTTYFWTQCCSKFKLCKNKVFTTCSHHFVCTMVTIFWHVICVAAIIFRKFIQTITTLTWCLINKKNNENKQHDKNCSPFHLNSVLLKNMFCYQEHILWLQRQLKQRKNCQYFEDQQWVHWRIHHLTLHIPIVIPLLHLQLSLHKLHQHCLTKKNIWKKNFHKGC